MESRDTPRLAGSQPSTRNEILAGWTTRIRPPYPCLVMCGEEMGLVAERCGVPVEFAEQLHASNLLPHEPDGTIGAGAERRLRLLGFALARGVTQDDLLGAVRAYGDLLGAFDDLAPTPLAAADLTAVGLDVGLPPGLVHEIIAAIGSGPDDPMSTDDLAALRSAKQALDVGLPAEVLLELLRVFSANMERLAEAENRIFHDNVHERFRAQGLSGRELLEATAAVGDGLLDLVEPTVVYFHRRAWARAARLDFLRHLTEDSRLLPSAKGAASCAVMFADLSGFTPLTAAMGDDAAAEVLARFAAAVRRLTAEHDGRVVKQIGDAFMLVFDAPRNAVLCGAALLAWCGDEPRFPPVHIGAHAGEVLFREGDFVGAVVNAAARVASVTEPMQFLVTAEVLGRDEELPEGIFATSLGLRELKGLHEPLHLSSLSEGTMSPPPRQHDPVCGMSVGPHPETRVVRGRPWLFCSVACADQFLAAPARYASDTLENR